MFRTWWNLSNSQGVEKYITFFHVLRKFSQCKHHFWRQSVNVNLRRLKAEEKSLHNNTHLSPAQIFRLIDRDVRNTITSRRHSQGLLHQTYGALDKMTRILPFFFGQHSDPSHRYKTTSFFENTKLFPFLFFYGHFYLNFCQESCM